MHDFGDSDYPTIRVAAKRIPMGERALRAAVRRGELEIHRVPGAWPRLFWPQVQAWLRASRVRGTPHAEARLAEVLARETVPPKATGSRSGEPAQKEPRT